MHRLFSYLFALWLFVAANPLFAQQPSIIPGVLYVKVDQQSSLSDRSGKVFSLNEDPILSYEPVAKTTANQRRVSSILDGLYRIEVNESTDIQALCEELRGFSNVVYAEPLYREELLYTPDDPDATNGNQDYLGVIKAFEAWDITQGDESMVIGISDTGIDLDHEDLSANLFTNENDPFNGIDDDQNGYIDDYRGYDFADDDSLSEAESNSHGTRVAGLAGADTDNGKGIAGVGFDTKVSSLKAYSSVNSYLFGGYESIVYAADNGYDVINLSWGSASSYSQAIQDIITYAIQNDVVVVAAAGNSNKDERFYPASYEGVLSVAASNLNDEKASFSAYSHRVDLMAPGNQIYSTADGNGFQTGSGTSYSAPLVAGAAALVKSVFPDYTNLQIAQQLRVTSDPVGDVAGNDQYHEKIGFGRLNVFSAVTDSTARSLRLHNFQYASDSGAFAFYGDTLALSFRAVNYLAPLANGFLTFSSESPYVEVIQDSVSLSSMSTLEASDISEKVIRLTEDTPHDTPLEFRLGISDGAYSDYQYFTFTTSPDLLTLDNGHIQLNLFGNGNMTSSGDGLVWADSLVANQLGVMIAQSESTVADNLPFTFTSSQREQDFSLVKSIRMDSNPVTDLHLSNSFNDDSASAPSGILVEQNTLTDNEADFFIQEYRLINQSDASLLLQVGFYADWALPIDSTNRAYYDQSSNTLIAFNQDSSFFAGIRTYLDKQPVAQAIDLGNFHGNVADLSDSLSDSLKYHLSSRVLADSAGWLGQGNDIAVVLSQDSLKIDPSRSQKATFLIGFGRSFVELQTHLGKADSVYADYLGRAELLDTYISCAGGAVTLVPQEGQTYRFFTDYLAQNLIAEGDSLVTGEITSDTTFFVARVEENYESALQRIHISLVGQVADFSMSTDTLFLDQAINEVSFADSSFQAISWYWDFDNGQQASLQNPTMYFTEPGTYEITLAVTTATGCEDTLTKSLLVANRPPIPEIADQYLCNGEDLILFSENADSIALYINASDSDPLLSGDSIKVDDIQKDTVFFMTNVTDPFESLKKEVKVFINDAEASYTYRADTTSEDLKAVFINTSPQTTALQWYVDAEQVSQEDTLRLAVTKNQYDMALKVTNTTGCVDSIASSIAFSSSRLPSFEFEQPCAGTDFTIAPGSGQFFGFYADEALTELIKKGAALTLKNVVASQTIYAVGLDSILPSQPLAIEIDPQQPQFAITATPDTLFLDEQLTATFSTSGDMLSSWKWYLDSVFIETVAAPVLFFDESGTHLIQLIGKDAEGCENEDTMFYQVMNKRPMEAILSANRNAALFFPNPAWDQILFTLSGLMTISNAPGQVILKKDIDKNERVDISKLPSGVYLIEFRGDGQYSAQRLIIR